MCRMRGKRLALPWPVPTTPSVLHPAGFITCLALEPLEITPQVFLPSRFLPSISLGNLPAFPRKPKVFHLPPSTGYVDSGLFLKEEKKAALFGHRCSEPYSRSFAGTSRDLGTRLCSQSEKSVSARCAPRGPTPHHVSMNNYRNKENMKLYSTFKTFFTHPHKVHAFYPQEYQITDILNLRALSYRGAKSPPILSVSQTIYTDDRVSKHQNVTWHMLG